MIWRIRNRATFSRLGRGASRARVGAISVTCVLERPGEPPKVGYAVGKSVGPAVVRNRLRRRLRAVVRAHEGELLEGRAYLVYATPRTSDLTPGELDAAVSSGLRRAGAMAPGDDR